MKNDILKSIYDWNPWLTQAFPQELRGINRDYQILEYLKLEEIKILDGARRVGKSTLLYQVIEHLSQHHQPVLYINFDDEELRKYTLKQIVHVCLEKFPVDYLFLDEIQQCNEWVHFVRNSYDRKEIKQLWISGSNSSLIKQEYKSLFTGRNIAIHISPLSFKEYLRFKGHEQAQLPVSSKAEIEIQKHFDAYLKIGAFPAISQRTIYQKELLINYFEDFLYKDIASRFDVNTTKLKELGLYLATNSGKIFSYRNIAKVLNMHPNTVMNYISHFIEIFLFSELYKFDYSLKEQLGSEKKIYCVDTGLAAAVSFRFSEDTGHMLENLVYNELKRQQHEIYFHKKNKECDFIIKEGHTITKAIQVSLSISDPSTKQREVNGLIDAMLSHKLREGLLLTLSEEGAEKLSINEDSLKINILPIWKWILMNTDNL